MSTAAGGLSTGLLEEEHLRDVQPRRIFVVDLGGGVELVDNELHPLYGTVGLRRKHLWTVQVVKHADFALSVIVMQSGTL
jgi:hypothetical protein